MEVFFRRIKAEIVADRIIINGISEDSPQYAMQVQKEWQAVYPDEPVPEIQNFTRALWTSTKAMLGRKSVRTAALNHQQAFACERVIQYHVARIYPASKMDEVRAAVEADLKKMLPLNGFDIATPVLSYTMRGDSLRPSDKGRFSTAEKNVIEQMYQWLVSQYADRVAAAAEAEAAVAPDSAKPAAVYAENAPYQKQDSEKSVENAKPKPSRRRDARRDRSPEEQEEIVLTRLKGQLAVDLLVMMNGELKDEDAMEVDAALSGRQHFIAACQECEDLPDEEYKDAKKTGRMWEILPEPDQVLYRSGSVAEMLDSRCSLILSRCIILAIAEADKEDLRDRNLIMKRAYELWQPFGLRFRTELINRYLKQNLERCMVGGCVPESVQALLCDAGEAIRSAYELYLEQIGSEQQLFESEVSTRLAEQRKFDQKQLAVMQHNRDLDLIRKFTLLEEGAALNWLCMAANGVEYSKERLLYNIGYLMQRLELIGLKPVAADKAARVFTGGEEGTETIVDLQGRPLEAEAEYQLVQLGWEYGGSLVVRPVAERK